MSKRDIPRAVAEAVLSIGGMTLRCYVLDDGQRVIDADDAARFFRAMESRDFRPGADELHELAKFCHGR